MCKSKQLIRSLRQDVLLVHDETAHQSQLKLTDFLVGPQKIAELAPGLLHQVFLIFLYDLGADAGGGSIARIAIELIYPTRSVLNIELVSFCVPLPIKWRTDDWIINSIVVLLQVKLEVDVAFQIIEKASNRTWRGIFKVGSFGRPWFRKGLHLRALECAFQTHHIKRRRHALRLIVRLLHVDRKSV